MSMKIFSKSISFHKPAWREIWQWMRNFPWFPVLLPIFTILFFLDHNIAQVDSHAADRLLWVFSLISILILVILKFVFRDIQRAGLVVFIFGLVFFTYPHIKFVLQEKIPLFTRVDILLPATLLFLAAMIYAVIKIPHRVLPGISMYLNGIFLALVVLQVGLIASYEFKMAAYWRSAQTQTAENAAQSAVSAGQSFPDVYFIVLDGYARADVLQSALNLDNTPFLDALRSRQFYVADCSVSNYAQTEESFASTLNMTYLDDILSTIKAPQLREDYFAPYIKHSVVRQFFESLGYQTVAFYTGYEWSEWTDATYFLGDPRSAKTAVKSLIPFESSFLSRTIFTYLTDDLAYLGIGKSSQVTQLVGSQVDRDIVLNTLNELPVVAQLRGPKLVFAHILLPHPPYVFGPNGEPQNLYNNVSDVKILNQGYRDQVVYANQRIIPIIDSILAASKGNVIIVLEGDHGIIQFTDGAEHMKNLEAYYFPNHDYADLYPSITPVNSFRVILSDFFGQKYPLLKDLSYFTDTSADKNFTLIPNTCTSK